MYTSLAANVGDFHIYSSEIGTWKVCVKSFSLGPNVCLDGDIYWKGCVHWLSLFHVKYKPASAVPDGLYFVEIVRVCYYLCMYICKQYVLDILHK